MTIHPNTQTLRPGDFFRVECIVRGSEPIAVEWSRVHGAMSAAASDHDGTLEIVAVTATDAGHYRCVAVNDAGRTETYSELIVIGS